MYSRSDIVLLDDPFSSLDAYVGKSLLDNCLLGGPLAGSTRLLVTHALHVLEKTDYIYIVGDAKVQEQGTFSVHIHCAISVLTLTCDRI